MQHVKVRSLNSPKSGRPVANQFVIETARGQYFQSYNSIIVFIPQGEYTKYNTEKENKITLDQAYWDYSRTTGKYRNIFLGENTAETRKKIKSGVYRLANLNY